MRYSVRAALQGMIAVTALVVGSAGLGLAVRVFRLIAGFD